MGAIDNFVHETPPSIKNFYAGPTGTPKEPYEAYVYRYTNLDDGKMYVGVHKGYVGDGYWQSSTNKEFSKVFASADSNLKLEILKYGSFSDMLMEEARILIRDNAKDNPMYYNKSNGSIAVLPPDVDLMQELANDITFRKYPVTKELIEDVDTLLRLQVRLEEDKDHRREIKERIEDAGGNTDKCSPIIICEGRGSQGEDIIIDGNHTLGGAKDAKHCTEVPVMRVPKSVHKKYTDEELIGVGSLLNKKPEIVKKPISVADAIKYIVNLVDTGIKHDADEVKRYLLACGFTRKRVSAILQKAKDEIAKNALRLKNQLWIDYTTKAHKPTLEATVEGYRNSDTICVSVSSAMFKWDYIINQVFTFTEQDKKTGQYKKTKNKLVVVVHHPSLEGEEKWKLVYQPEVIRKLKYFFEPLGYSCKIHEMPTTYTNAPLSSE